MLEVIFLGHASLLIRGDGALLCDPIFGPTVSGGGNLINPPRRIFIENLDEISGVLLTHHHSDHFDVNELERIPTLRYKPFVVPAGSSVVNSLRTFGYENIYEVDAGDRLNLAGIEITATPSDVSFPEVGYYLKRGDAAILNLADTIFHSYLKDVRTIASKPAFVLAPFQAGGYMSLLPLRVGGAPKGLVDAIRVWSNEYLEELVGDLVTLNPLCVAPFADGICYLDVGINQWHFPLPDRAFAQAINNYGIPVQTASPGFGYQVSWDSVKYLGMVENLVEITGRATLREFNPACRLSDVPLPCSEGSSGENVGAVEISDTLSLLTKILNSNIKKYSSETDDQERFIRICEQWDLELVDVEDEMCRFVQIRLHDGLLVVETRRPDDTERPFGICAYWRDIERVLKRDIPLEYIKLSGAFRYKSPAIVENLEDIRSQVLWPLEALTVSTDPLYVL